MSYPPGASRSCHEADGRSDRSGGSSGRGFHHHKPNPSKATDNASSSVVTTSLDSQNLAIASYPTLLSPLPCTTMVPTVGASCTTSGDRRSNWSNWTLGLENLLQDTEGVTLFKTYLQYEGCANLLDFWFACQGFRSKVDPSDDRKILQLIKVIYRTYIRCSSTSTSGSGTSGSINAPLVQPIRLRAETRRLISERISRKHGLDQTVFDPAQTEVEHFLRTTAYPAFLKSDVYVEFLQTIMKDNRTMPHQPPYHQQQHFYYHQTPPPRPNWSNTGMMLMPAGSQASNLLDYRFPSPTMFASTPGSGTGNTITPKTLPTVDEDRELRSEELTSVPNSADADPFPGSLHHQPPPPPSALFTGSGDFGRYIHEHPPSCACCPPRSYILPDNRMPWAPPVIPRGETITFISTSGPRPLTVDNNQATGFHRADYPVDQHVQQQTAIRQMEYQYSDMFHVQNSLANPQAMASGRAIHRQYTHWPDSICEGSSNQAHRLCRCSQHHQGQHYGHHHRLGQFPSRLHHPTSSSRRQQQHVQHQPQVNRESGESWMLPAGLVPTGATTGLPMMTSSPPEAVCTTAGTGGSDSRQHTRRSSTGRRVAARPGAVPGGGARMGVSDSGTSNAQEQGQLQQPNNRGVALSKPTSSSTRSHNLAERDPQAFFNLLSEKLQRVLDSQLASERLDHLMASTNAGTTNETSPNLSQPEVTSCSIAPGARDSGQSGGLVAAVAPLVLTTPSTSSGETAVGGGHNRLASELPASSVLRRPWADRLLAAARVQHENTKDDAQAILEDHCSRIWAASADRTPTTSSGSGGSPPDTHDNPVRQLDPDQPVTKSGVALVPADHRVGPAGDVCMPAQRGRQRRHPSGRHVSGRHQSGSVGVDARRQRSRSNKTRLGEGGREMLARRRVADYEEECEEEEMSGSKLLTELLPDSAYPCSSPPLATPSLVRPHLHASGRPAGDRLDHVVVRRTKELAISSSGLDARRLEGTGHRRDVYLEEEEEEHASSQVVISPTLSSHSSSPLVAMTTAPPCLTTTSDSAESTGGCLQSNLFASNSHSSSSGGGGVALGALVGLPETTVPTVTTTAMTTGATTATSNTSSSSMSGGSGSPLVIGYYLGDDPVPYRSLWIGTEITLGQFKQLIPKKKGSFRYFFKKVSDEFDCGVVHQEVTHDDCVLPLWEGKVVAKVERVD